MKLGYLVANFPQLSETFVSNEIDRLIRRGMDISIYSFSRPSEDDAKKLTTTAKILADRTHYLDKLDTAVSALLRPADMLRLYRKNSMMQNMSTSKPSKIMRMWRAIALGRKLQREGVTHLHVHWPYSTEVAYLINQLTGIPYSVSIHAHEVAHENGHFKAAFETLSFATYCNRGAMEHLLEQLPSEARDKSHLVYHGVDIRDFEPLPMPEINGTFNVVTAGRLTRTKGFDRLIRACAMARENGMDVRLSILGRGDMEDSLLEAAQDANYSDYLDMPGWVSHDQVREYMEHAHVFALLADTSFHDGLPNVVLEAMASSRPVILSPLPAAGEAVDNGKEGFVLNSPEDYMGFVESLKILNNTPGLAESMGKNARERVCRDHDAESQIELLQKLFSHELNNTKVSEG